MSDAPEQSRDALLSRQHKNTSFPGHDDLTMLGSTSTCKEHDVATSFYRTSLEKDRDQELLDNLEIYRRSAVTYLNQYLDCLRLVHEQRPSLVSEVNSDQGCGVITHTGKSALKYILIFPPIHFHLPPRSRKNSLPISNSASIVPDLALREHDLDTDTTGWTREQWRLKVYRDSLLRDLLAMEEALDVLGKQATNQPQRQSLIPGSFFGVSTGAL